MSRLIAIGLGSALMLAWLNGAHAQNAFPTPGGSSAVGEVVMCASAANAALKVPCDSTNPLAVTVAGGTDAVTIADGADVTQGTTTDAACATDNGTCTVEAVLKRIAQRVTSLITALGTPFQAGGSIGNLFALDATLTTTNTDIGPPGATACATDTGSCSLNALIQRSLQRLTTIIAGIPVTNAGTFAVQATLPTTPLIASGNGVVNTPTTEAAAGIAPSTAVTVAESCRVLQASAANVFRVTVAIAATSGYVMISNTTTAPGDGAVTLAWPAIRIVSDGTSGWADISFNPPLRLSTGATVCFSSTGPFTKTASATAAIGGLVK